MKFPLASCPFPPLQLDEAERHKYEQLTCDVLDATMDKFTHFVDVQHRKLPETQWKPIKTREGVTVYKQLAVPATPQPLVRGRQQPAETRKWSLPKLTAVGTIAGTLDDIIYGIVTLDAPSIVVKTSYVHDELVDSAVLQTLRSATIEDPFQYVGVKWIAKCHPMAINSLFKPRDLVVVESTGIQTLANGDPIGYHVMHSIDHPLYPELPHLSLVRSKMSSCYLYKQQLHKCRRVVEVFMVSYVEPGGFAPEPLALLSCAASLIGIWKSVRCAENKKLTWLLDNHNAQSSRATTATTEKTCCRLCEKKLRPYHTVRNCELCAASVCPRCSLERTLSKSNEKLQLVQRTVVVCTNCVLRATKEDALAIARKQYVPAKAIATAKQEQQPQALATQQSLPLAASLLTGQTDRDSEMQEQTAACSWSGPSCMRGASAACDWVVVPTGSSYSSFASTPSSSGSISSLHRLSEDDLHHQKSLYLQMNQLCLAAEQTYLVAKQNTTALRFSPLT